MIRFIKLVARPGDNAETAMIELVDFNEVYGKGKGEAKTAAKAEIYTLALSEKGEDLITYEILIRLRLTPLRTEMPL